MILSKRRALKNTPLKRFYTDYWLKVKIVLSSLVVGLVVGPREGRDSNIKKGRDARWEFKGDKSGHDLYIFWPLKETNKTSFLKQFAAFLHVQPYARPWRLKILVIFPQHPKRDQNLKFTPLSETISIPTFFICRVPPPPPGGGPSGCILTWDTTFTVSLSTQEVK